MLTKSSTEMVRQQNSALVLAALRRHGSLAHTDIAAATGLASGTVSAITADLERIGALERHEQPAAGGRGRPRVLFARRRDFAYLVSARIASDSVQYSLTDYTGTLIDRFEEPRDHAAPSPKAFIAGFRDALSRLSQRSKLAPERIAAVSVSSKGMVDTGGSRLLWSPVFGHEEIDFSTALDLAPQTRIRLNNETLLVAHALGLRADKDTARPFHALTTLSLGHAIGLGIARRGHSGELDVSAPNFGHMLNAADGKLCRCGSFGCVEASAGFYGILRTAFEVPPDTIPAKFVPLTEMDKIANRARQGHRMSEYAFRQAGLALGQGLSRVLSLYENMPIVITGYGTRYMDLLTRGLDEGLSQSLHVRLHGAPEITIVPEEATLVFEGHLDRALTEIDHEVAGLRAEEAVAR
ncbi:MULTISPECIES: ROK family transcriptional regulator [Alphaproteobacteria]|uniref:Transcriptional regulator n=2 Tax=Alphaproteobacteria TaxID=28211 RepID=A0A512HFP8_9HYPH|nr:MULTISPECIES: ROK family transcriptional regulator [Alphaproteobacteria]GEO84275.1 transcriptional regulator [Ciceribacter naphthalenivorans]GLR24811.1 transcriptional regulator [Ciceribacter naphthalenivorans]GLT07667.1 transcriptional regulator [Sphingomonas psychrolutea]